MWGVGTCLGFSWPKLVLACFKICLPVSLLGLLPQISAGGTVGGKGAWQLWVDHPHEIADSSLSFNGLLVH